VHLFVIPQSLFGLLARIPSFLSPLLCSVELDTT
jgi:hypothetical protein